MPRPPSRPPRHVCSLATRLAPVAVSAAACLAAAPSRAEPPRPAALAWTRAPGAEQCPTGQAIAAEVERVLAGRPLVSTAQADIVVEGRITRAGDDFESTLTLVSREGAVLGTRRLTTSGPECAAVRAEVGLVIALMIDPDAVLRPGSSTAPSSPTSGPAAVNPADPTARILSPGTTPLDPGAPPGPLSPGSFLGAPPAPSAPLAAPPCPPAPPPPAPPPPWRTHLSTGPLIGLGLLPGPAVGARLRAAITPPGLFPFELSGDLFAPSRAEAEGVGLEMFLAQGRVRACPLTGTFTRWGLVACGGFDFGGLRGGGFGFPVDRSADLFTAAASAGGRVHLRLGTIVLLSLGLDLAVPFVRARVSYAAPEGGRRELFLTSPITGTADLALGIEM